jgi:phosphatidate cytidylyltransferase
MNPEGLQRLLSTEGAFSHPVTLLTIGIGCLGVGAALIAGPILSRSGRLSPAIAQDIRTRTLTWAVIIPLVLAPIIAAPIGAILLAGLLSILCYREFARATGLFRERMISALVAIGLLLVTFANLDHWKSLVGPIQTATLSAICIFCVFQDRPKGSIQRAGLGIAAFILFGIGLGRMGMLANHADYRPILCAIFLSVQMNDIFAYCVGRALGKGKWFPNTSPGKTIAGHLGAAALTTPLAAVLYHLTFKGSSLDQWWILAILGLMTSILGQLGDLIISSVKRDVGIKDMGAILPGHGGILDRCNSLLLVTPAMYQVIIFFGRHESWGPARIFTGD